MVGGGIFHQNSEAAWSMNDVLELRLRAELGELVRETANPDGDRQSEIALSHAESN